MLWPFIDFIWFKSSRRRIMSISPDLLLLYSLSHKTSNDCRSSKVLLSTFLMWLLIKNKRRSFPKPLKFSLEMALMEHARASYINKSGKFSAGRSGKKRMFLFPSKSIALTLSSFIEMETPLASIFVVRFMWHVLTVPTSQVAISMLSHGMTLLASSALMEHVKTHKRIENKSFLKE